MLPLLACLLLTTSALASDHRGDIPYDASLYASDTDPIDSNDFTAPPRNPNSNIFYSFEQIRRDKTSQVDVREEDVGRYMYRPRITTTTRAPDVVEPRKPVIIPDVYMPPVKVNRWVDSSTTMAPPPPAPSPKWNGFDLDFRQSPFSQYKPEPRTYDAIPQYSPPRPYHYVSKPQHLKTTVAPVISQYKSEPRIYDYVSKPQQSETTVASVSQSSEPTRYFIQPTGKTYVNQEHASEETTISTTTTTIKPHMRSKLNSRGSYRFNQRELASPASRTLPVQPSVSKSPAPPAVKKPPPPVPTLTPWAGDNF